MNNYCPCLLPLFNKSRHNKKSALFFVTNNVTKNNVTILFVTEKDVTFLVTTFSFEKRL